MGILCSIPQRTDGQLKLVEIKPDFVVTSPFVHSSLSPIASPRNAVYEVRDMLKVFKLTRPLIWKMDETEGSSLPDFLPERSWPGRKIRHEVNYFVIPWVFTGKGPGADGSSGESGSETTQGQTVHSQLTKDALIKASTADSEADRDRRDAETQAGKVPEPDPEEQGTIKEGATDDESCLLYTSPSPRD